MEEVLGRSHTRKYRILERALTIIHEVTGATEMDAKIFVDSDLGDFGLSIFSAERNLYFYMWNNVFQTKGASNRSIELSDFDDENQFLEECAALVTTAL